MKLLSAGAGFSVGAGLAREQKGAVTGPFLVPEYFRGQGPLLQVSGES
jgi:hypothetical protein